jgi:hypothetical protein
MNQMDYFEAHLIEDGFTNECGGGIEWDEHFIASNCGWLLHLRIWTNKFWKEQKEEN